MTLGKGRKRVLVLGSCMRATINFRGPLVRDLVRQGHAVTVAAPGLDETAAAQIGAMGACAVDVALPRTGMNPLADLAYLARLRALLKRERPDLLVTATAKPNIWGAFAAHGLGIASVAMVTGLGYAFTPQPNGTRLARLKQHAANLVASRLYRAATRLNRHVVFQNPDDAHLFLSSGSLRDPFKVVMTNGSGVDTRAFALAPLPKTPSVLMVSRLLGNKGVREYAAAAAELKREWPDATFRLVGYVDIGPDGIPAHEIESWTERGLDYLGPRADVRQVIREANICVLPSYREGTPRALLEAMAMGRPIVTSDAPGCRETVIEGANGHLVPVRDARALADRLRRLMRDADERTRMGREGRALAERRYEVGRVNRTLIADLGLAS